MSTPLTTVRALYSALEAGQHGEALRRLFTDDATTLEHPNALKPRGARYSLEEGLAASAAGAGLLESQQFDVQSAVEFEDTAIVRLTWTGVVARDIGPFHEGQVLTAHIAQFIRVRDARVASIETFDCYEPFSPTTSAS